MSSLLYRKTDSLLPSVIWFQKEIRSKDGGAAFSAPRGSSGSGCGSSGCGGSGGGGSGGGGGG